MARSLGLPVRALGIVFLVLLAVVAAEATQAVGALLLLGLLAAPGGAARLLTDRPWRGLALSAAIAVASMWVGLALSYRIASLPASSAVIGVATGFLLLAALRAWLRSRCGRRAGRCPALAEARDGAARIEAWRRRARPSWAEHALYALAGPATAAAAPAPR